MKLFSKLICAALLVLSPGLAGQTNMISSGNDLFNFMNTDPDYIRNNRDRYAEIEGSPYLEEAFHSGSVSFKGKKYMGLQLRHNLYKGYFEFQTEEGIKFFDPQTTPIDTIWLDNDTYLYVLYRSGKDLKRNYMKLMNPGKTIVLQFSQVILIQANAAKGYEEAKPAHFEKRSEAIYILTGNQPATEFKGRKSLPEIFPEQHRILSDYAKAEKMKMKNVGDIISLCAYYDTLY